MTGAGVKVMVVGKETEMGKEKVVAVTGRTTMARAEEAAEAVSPPSPA